MMENYEKKYKEALKRAKYLKENTDSVGAKDISYTFEQIFPELKESEDEKIRKGLIKGLSAMRDIHHHQTFSDDAINIDDAIAWLEKQGEQKSTTQYNYVKFREGDTVQKITGDKDIVTIAEVDTEAEVYRLTNTGFIPFKYEHLWHIVEQEWSEEDEKIMKRVDSLLYSQCQIHGSEYEELHNWLKSLKPNHWKPSEDKNETKNKCPNYSEGYGCSTSPLKQCDTCPEYKLYNHWKPSEEQLRVLQIAIRDYGICAEKNVLESLYNDLKKL